MPWRDRGKSIEYLTSLRPSPFLRRWLSGFDADTGEWSADRVRAADEGATMRVCACVFLCECVLLTHAFQTANQEHRLDEPRSQQARRTAGASHTRRERGAGSEQRSALRQRPRPPTLPNSSLQRQRRQTAPESASPQSARCDRRQDPPLGRGIVNSGSTCFMIVVVRMLHCIFDQHSPLGRSLRYQDSHLGIYANMPIARQLAGVLKLLDQSSHDAISHQFQSLCRAVQTALPDIRMNRQNDAAEVYLAVLDRLLQETFHVGIAFPAQQSLKIRTLPRDVAVCPECPRSLEQSSYACRLAVTNDRRTSVQLLLNELLAGDLRQCACGANLPKLPLVLASTPDYLCLEVSRVAYINARQARFYKRTTVVSIDKQLVVPARRGNAVGSATFQLALVVGHLGAPNAGHYVTYTPQPEDGSWICANDDRVFRTTDNFVFNGISDNDLRRSCAVLLYRRAPLPE
jgi:hypothetical protein